MFDRIAVAYWKHQRTGEVTAIEKFVSNPEEQERAIRLLKSKQLRPVVDILSTKHNWSEEFTLVERNTDLDWIDKLETGEKALLHQTELWKHVKQLEAVYNHQGKEIKSPLMKYLSLMLKTQIPKSLGLVHKRAEDEISIPG